MQRMKKNKKSPEEGDVMSNTVRIDRDAFRRGVEDIMTLAPLREAVSQALASKKPMERTGKSTSVRERGSEDERNYPSGKQRK